MRWTSSQHQMIKYIFLIVFSCSLSYCLLNRIFNTLMFRLVKLHLTTAKTRLFRNRCLFDFVSKITPICKFNQLKRNFLFEKKNHPHKLNLSFRNRNPFTVLWNHQTFSLICLTAINFENFFTFSWLEWSICSQNESECKWVHGIVSLKSSNAVIIASHPKGNFMFKQTKPFD